MHRYAAAGNALVAAQFALIVWLVWPFTPQTWSAAALALLGAALALGLWTLLHNPPGNFNVRPQVKARARLVTSGPYRYLRNPMYSALMLFALAECVAYRDPWKILCALALALVLYAKVLLEERALHAFFPEYAAYARRVRRFIPWVF